MGLGYTSETIATQEDAPVSKLTADDRLDIQELMARYSRAIDFGRFEELPGFFTDDCTLELVNRLRRADFAHQADTIEGRPGLGAVGGFAHDARPVAILAVLDDPPKGLAELRAALLSERVWRRSEGIS